jgi:hypothetical protein
MLGALGLCRSAGGLAIGKGARERDRGGPRLQLFGTCASATPCHHKLSPLLLVSLSASPGSRSSTAAASGPGSSLRRRAVGSADGRRARRGQGRQFVIPAVETSSGARCGLMPGCPRNTPCAAGTLLWRGPEPWARSSTPPLSTPLQPTPSPQAHACPCATHIATRLHKRSHTHTREVTHTYLHSCARRHTHTQSQTQTHGCILAISRAHLCSSDSSSSRSSTSSRGCRVTSASTTLLQALPSAPPPRPWPPMALPPSAVHAQGLSALP